MISYLNTPIFGIALTIIVFSICDFVSRKLKISLLNPIALSIVAIIYILKYFNISHDTYENGASMISFFLGPATVALALPLYKKINLLMDHFIPIIMGALIGSLTGVVSVIFLGKLFKIDKILILSMIPKSTTSAISMDIAKEIGGSASLAIIFVIATGILGNVIGPGIFKIFRINNKVAKGIAMGTSAHVAGTAKAVEMGEVEGGMSSLAIGIAGLITVIIVPIILKFIDIL